VQIKPKRDCIWIIIIIEFLVIGANFCYFGKIMIWIVVGLIVFVCVFLLVERIHVAKGDKYEETIGISNEEVKNGLDSGE